MTTEKLVTVYAIGSEYELIDIDQCLHISYHADADDGAIEDPF